MLLVHWSKHNQTDKILKNGIRPSSKSINGHSALKGIWCFPYSRNKTFNTNWKSILKNDRGTINYNGFVFRLEESDFPIYAGEFGSIVRNPEKKLFQTYEAFVSMYGHEFSPKSLSLENKDEPRLDYRDFEIIVTQPISSDRIIKVLKDREPRTK